MISKESILHIPKSHMAYGYDDQTLHIRLRTKRDELKKVVLRIGDPYIWAQGGADGGNLDSKGASGWISGQNIPMNLERSTDLFDYWSAFYKPSHKRSRYAFILESEDDRLLYGERHFYSIKDTQDPLLNDLSNFFCFPYLHKADVHHIPEWVKDTVWYQIFPDRFNRASKDKSDINIEPWGSKPSYDNFMGGDLQGIINKLDYLKDLGVNGIYLCPIFKASSNHRYDTIDYLEIDEMLGTKATFKKFVQACHERNIKVMLDAVFNHMGYQSPMWQDVVENHEESIYKDWFEIHKFPVYDQAFEKLNGNQLNYETFGRSKKMPKVNTSSQEVIDYFIHVAKYWIEAFDIDAWRIDVANEVDHKFWRKFREATKAAKSEVYLLGEIWHDARPWLEGDQFDASMNYPLTESIIKYFCTNEINKDQFIAMTNQLALNYTLQVHENLFNLLDSHDTIRIYSIASENVQKIKLAYIFMFSQPGTPCIYYGSEIPMAGIKGPNLEDHRSCMTFNHDQDSFFQFMKRLIQLRHQEKALKSTNITFFNIENPNILAYIKEDLFIILNNSPKDQTWIFNDHSIGIGEIIMADSDYKIESKINLKPYGYILIKTKEA